MCGVARATPLRCPGATGAGVAASHAALYGIAAVFMLADAPARHKSTGCLSGPSRVLEMYLYPGIRANLADLEEQETLKVL